MTRSKPSIYNWITYGQILILSDKMSDKRQRHVVSVELFLVKVT